MIAAVNANNRLRESREDLGYSPEEVATQIGATVPEVLAAEAGAPIGAEALRTLARLYLRPPGYLLGTDDAVAVPPAPAIISPAVGPARRADAA